MYYTQKNSLFVPALTTRGPVYQSPANYMGALPNFSAPSLLIAAGLAALGLTKKIPLTVALGGAAAAILFLSPSSANPPAGSLTTPAVPPIDLTSSIAQLTSNLPSANIPNA
jgi:hypothetical protein